MEFIIKKLVGIYHKKFILFLTMNLELIKKTGVAAAYKGAKIVKSCFGNIDHVTKADLGSEEILATNGNIHDEMLSLLKIKYAVGRP